MHWTYIPYLILIFCSVVMTLVGAGISLQRRSSPGAKPLAALLTAIAIWSFGYWMELTVSGLPAKLFWARFEYFGTATISLIWLLLALEYTGRGSWITRPRLALLSVIPALTLLIMWTPATLKWMYVSVHIGAFGEFTPLVVHHGWFFWIFIAYSYSISLVGIVLLLISIRAGPSGNFRRRQLAILFGAAIPLASDVVYVSGWNPVVPLDPAPFAFCLTGLLTFWAVYQFSLLEASPAARSAAFEYLHDAVFIVAANGQVLDANPAARQFVADQADPIGRPLTEALPSDFPAAQLMALTHAETVELDLGENRTPRHIEASLAFLPEASSHAARIIMLRDISERRLQWHQLQENEKNLVESKAMYASLVETLPQYILRKDAAGRIIFANQNHLRLNGLSPEEMVGKTDFDLYPAELAEKYRQDDEYVMSTGQSVELVEEHCVNGKDKILVRVIKTPILGPDGKPNGLQCIFWDVTEQEQAEQALIESEQRFRASVDSLLDGFAVYSSVRNAQGKIVDFVYEYINDAGCRLNMRPRGEHIGHTLLELLPNQVPTGLFDEKVQVVETGQAVMHESLLYEDSYGDGKRLARAFDYQAIKLGDGLAVTWRDVTERKRREMEIEQKNQTIQHMYAELQENERRFRASIESLVDGFAIFTPVAGPNSEIVDFITEYVNEVGCQMIGQPLERLIGARISYAMPFSHDLGLVNDFISVVKTGEPLIREIDIPSARTEGSLYLDVRAVCFGEGLAISWRDITERKLAEEKRAHWVFDLEQRNREIMLLNNLGELLQACLSYEEAFRVIAEDVYSFFPDCSGAMYVINNSRTRLERVTGWGNIDVFAQSMDPSDCWGLRLGKLHQAQGDHSKTVCNHFERGHAAGMLCAPMMAQTEAYGVLSLYTRDGSHAGETDYTETRRQLLETVAEQISLALANLKLRETLRYQAIRDALTELFNYRYMEETLEREIARAQRKNLSLGVLMLDIDHFKLFNDEYGHAVGDAVLREMGKLLLTKTRKEDVACRYGGEEFLVIMPDAGEPDILARAEELRASVERMHLYHNDRLLRDITVSIGVAVFPLHGETVATLMRAADTALYDAKTTGRNQVRVVKMAT